MEGTFESARAAHNPMTVRAPAARSAIAASVNVLAVVTTSSTNQICSGTCRPRRERNAPRTLRRRSYRSRPVWLGVSRVRQSATGSKRIPNSRARDRASSAAGLKPRNRSRRGCSGTGTTRPGWGSDARYPASCSIASTTDAGAGSSPRSPCFGYLKRWIQSAAPPSKRNAAKQAVNAEFDSSQVAHRLLPGRGGISWHNWHAPGAIRSSWLSQAAQSTAVGSIWVPQPPQVDGSTNSSAPRDSSASLRKASTAVAFGRKGRCSAGSNGVVCGAPPKHCLGAQGSQTIRLRPVISADFGRPIRSRTVGARSARLPSRRW